jgi:hypothetical protein
MTESYRFQKEMAQIICEYGAVTWQFLPWVEKLANTPIVAKILRHIITSIWANPNGIDMALKLNLPMSWKDLSANPHPWAIARLEANPEKIAYDIAYGNSGFDMDKLMRTYNTDRVYRADKHRAAMNPRDAYVNKLITPIAWNGGVNIMSEEQPFASMNPNPRIVAFLINGKQLYIDKSTAWANPNPEMFKYMMENVQPISWKYLSMNPHPDALEMMRNSPKIIVWESFLTNPGIFAQQVDKEVLKLLI